MKLRLPLAILYAVVVSGCSASCGTGGAKSPDEKSASEGEKEKVEAPPPPDPDDKQPPVDKAAEKSAVMSIGASSEKPSSESKDSTKAADKKSGDAKAAAEAKPAEPKPAPAPEVPKLSGSALAAHEAGLKAFRSGDLEGAKTQFQKATRENKQAYESFVALGLVEEKSGNVEAALNAYKQALAIVPTDANAAYALAVLTARKGNPDGAANFLKEKLVASPNSAALLGALAEVSSVAGNSADAQRYAQEALKKDPAYEPAMITLARDHYRARRVGLALAVLGAILDGAGESSPPRNPNNADARLLRGVIYVEKGLRGPAIEDLKKAVSVRSDLVEAHTLLAKYYLESGGAKDAEKELAIGLRFDKRNIQMRAMLGDCYRMQNKPVEARKELEWVLATDPSQVGVHYNLGVLFLLTESIPGMTKQQQLDKAIEHLSAFKAKAPRGTADDVDELLNRATTDKAMLSEGGS